MICMRRMCRKRIALSSKHKQTSYCLESYTKTAQLEATCVNTTLLADTPRGAVG